MSRDSMTDRGDTTGAETPRVDEERGLYEKYLVERRDDPDGNHKNCEYFVLDLIHDKFSYNALMAYANACQVEFPLLAADLRRKAHDMQRRENGE